MVCVGGGTLTSPIRLLKNFKRKLGWWRGANFIFWPPVRVCIKLFQRRLQVEQKQIATLTTARFYNRSQLLFGSRKNSWTLRVLLVLLATSPFVSLNVKKTSIYRKTSFYWTEFRVPLISYPSTQRQTCCKKLQLDFKKTLEGQQYLLFTFSQNKPQELGGPSNFDDDTEFTVQSHSNSLTRKRIRCKKFVVQTRIVLRSIFWREYLKVISGRNWQKGTGYGSKRECFRRGSSSNRRWKKWKERKKNENQKTKATFEEASYFLLPWKCPNSS